MRGQGALLTKPDIVLSRLSPLFAGKCGGVQNFETWEADP